MSTQVQITEEACKSICEESSECQAILYTWYWNMKNEKHKNVQVGRECTLLKVKAEEVAVYKLTHDDLKNQKKCDGFQYPKLCLNYLWRCTYLHSERRD